MTPIAGQRKPITFIFSAGFSLAMICAVAVAAPVVAGRLGGQQGAAQAAQAAQTSTAPLPSFEVVSIKPSPPTWTGGLIMQQDAGRYIAKDVTVRSLIRLAYNIRLGDQMSGGPGWIDSEKYDIDAKVDDSLAGEMQKLSRLQQLERFRPMFQSLLEERFHLVVSHSTKELPIYALVVAKNGPKLTPTKSPPPDPANPVPPGSPSGRGFEIGDRELIANGVTMANLADMLFLHPDIRRGRLVVDETGIKGNFDFTLPWEASGLLQNSDRDPGAAPQPDSSGQSIFTALQQQLGLRLEPKKSPMDCIVVEHIDRPTGN